MALLVHRGRKRSLESRPRTLAAGAAAAARRTAGQSLAELALVLPLLLILALGTADLGRVFYALITVESAARQAARYAASHYYTDSPTFTKTAAVASSEASDSGIAIEPPEVTTTSIDSTPAVSVTVTHHFSLITGILGIAPFDISGTARMVVLEGAET